MLFDKQFGFQLNNSREYATLQLVNDISSSFKKGKYTLGIFIELPTISKLLEDCYLCTSMGKLITKACWIILLYIYYFLTEIRSQNSNLEPSLEKNQRQVCRRELSENYQNPFFITITALLHTDWYCQGTLKQTLDRQSW